MRDRRRTTIAALAGGVALASAAFAAGSQSGDGSATAKGGAGEPQVERAWRGAPPAGEGQVERAWRGAPPPGEGDVRFHPAPRRGGPGVLFLRHERLAERLGVSEERLHDAMRSLRPPGDPHDALADSLAKSLDVDADRVRDALEAFHRSQHEQFAERLAKELGIDLEKVKEALPAPPRP